MAKKRALLVAAAVMTAITAFFPLTICAQSMWLDHNTRKSFSIEILKPNLDYRFGRSTFLTSAVFLTLRYPISQTATFVAELPLAHYGFDSDFGSSDSENAIGNPYLVTPILDSNPAIRTSRSTSKWVCG